ncbi:hypothetical protein DFH08DRAFT_708599, partial [Mycena albidolilacea]
LANSLGMHRNTLRNYFKLYNVHNRFTKLSDHNLVILTRQFKRMRPKGGLRYLIGFLKTHSVKVQKARVRKSLIQLTAWANGRLARLAGCPVGNSNATWHMGGHHKLIKSSFLVLGTGFS